MYVPSPGRCVVSPAAGKLISLGDSRVQRKEGGSGRQVKKVFSVSPNSSMQCFSSNVQIFSLNVCSYPGKLIDHHP